MNKDYRILVLTDHQTHSAENSIYGLIPAINELPQCQSIHVASRSFDINKDFFSSLDTNLWVNHIDKTFRYSLEGNSYLKDLKKVSLVDFDAIFLRLPRPISDSFLLWLEQEFKGKPIVNKPSGIIHTSSKKFLLKFPHLCAPMQLVSSIDDVIDFARNFPIVLKPLKEYGGKGLVKIHGDQLDDGQKTWSTLEYLNTIKSQLEEEGYLAMKFLKNVTKGDKRIIVCNGEIIASSLRLPPKDSWLCNIAQGGTSIFSEADETEKNIVTEINPLLLNEGIILYGVDTLVNDDGQRVLSEINTLSIGGIMQSERQSNQPILSKVAQKIMDHVDRQYHQ